MQQPIQPAQAVPRDAPPEVPYQPVVGTPHPQAAARGYLPIYVFLAYIAFLITGFGTTLGQWRALPIYVFSALLLLTFQETIAAHRSHGRFVYTFLTSAFAVLFAGDAVFHPFARGNFALGPYIYLIIFAEVVAVYVWEVITRRMQHPDGLRGSLRSFTILAADFAGLAILLYLSAIVLDFLGPHAILRFFGFHPGGPFVTVDLDKTLGLHLRPPLNTLQGFSAVAGLVATTVVLLGFVVIGSLLPAGQQDATRLSLRDTLRAIWRDFREQVADALGVALAPLVWLIPAFAIAFFAQMVTTFLSRAAVSTGTTLDLFNPFSPADRASYGLGIETLLLGLFAVAMVALAVAIVEHDGAVVRYALDILETGTRVVLVTLVFFFYSLALINAILILVGATTLRPFQVGLPSLISLVLALGFFWRESSGRSRLALGATAVAVIVVIVFIAVASGQNQASIGSVSQGVYSAVTGVKPTVFAKVGTGGVKDPLVALPGGSGSGAGSGVTLTQNGKPEILYIGAEYCPYCAAERWSLVIALSRFGTIKGLDTISSSSSDAFPSTNTFTFVNSTYTSNYLAFVSREIMDQNHNPLQTLAPAQTAIFNQFDAPPYTTTQDKGGIPFIDFGNRYMTVGAGYSPGLLHAGQDPNGTPLTVQEIANKLSNPNDLVTQAIVGNANYLTAAICKVTNNTPASACNNQAIQQIEGQLPG